MRKKYEIKKRNKLCFYRYEKKKLKLSIEKILGECERSW